MLNQNNTDSSSAYRRLKNKREAIIAMANFQVGETVLVRGEPGIILKYIPAGSKVRVAWEQYLDENPEAVPATSTSFYSNEVMPTHRYFISKIVYGKPRVFCPYLNHLERCEQIEASIAVSGDN